MKIANWILYPVFAIALGVVLLMLYLIDLTERRSDEASQPK